MTKPKGRESDPNPVLELVDVRKKFPGAEREAVAGVSLRVHEGELLVISGANGSGKSVLMHLIAGLDAPTSGTLRLGRNGRGEAIRVGLVFQDASAQILGDTVLEDVVFGPRNMGLSLEEALIKGRESLTRVSLSAKERLPARTLSGGEKRRLAVAGILAMDAELIILDEPFANLDWPGVSEVISVIEALSREGKTIIVLTHELEKTLALADRLVVLVRGEKVYDGNPDDALRDAPLASWGIRNPLGQYRSYRDLVWRDAP